MPPAAVEPKAKRAVTTSAKATRAGDIAATKAQDEAAAVPVKKKCGRPKKKKEETPVPVPIKEDTATDSKDETDIEWTKELTWTLITAIESDEPTQDSLFPETFESAGINFWRGKIKNRIGVLVLKAKDNMVAMGETGAKQGRGLRARQRLAPGLDCQLNGVDLIKLESPWFFNMRTLIAARPNLHPVGLGNNETEIDTSILLHSSDADNNDTSSNGRNDNEDTSTAPDDTKDGTLSVEDSDEQLPAVTAIVAGALKRPRDAKSNDDPKAKQGAAKKTRPQKATSAPVAVVPVKKPTNTKDKFAATVLAEEETTQHLLGLK
ncbi:hypothetical protein C8R45DRAFT_948176 [Mycena sanguinolenta]|nr:hypothetical protein C8R45DRAFT_948176 [Mycena sanguinolenta]